MLTPGILTLTLILSLTTFLIGLIQVLFDPLMLTLSDPQTYGRTMIICASGLVFGSLMVSAAKVKDYSKQLIAGLAASGLMSLSGGVPQISAAGFCFFAALPLVNAGAEVLIRGNIDNALQGRAWGSSASSPRPVTWQPMSRPGRWPTGFSPDCWLKTEPCPPPSGVSLDQVRPGPSEPFFLAAGLSLLILSLTTIKNRALRLMAAPAAPAL